MANATNDFSSWQEQARSQRGRVWRLLPPVVAYVLVVGVLNGLMPAAEHSDGYLSELTALLSLALVFSGALLAFLLVWWLVGGRAVRLLAAPNTKARVTDAINSGAVWLMLLVAGAAASGDLAPSVAERNALQVWELAALVCVALVAVGIQATSEELVFRSYLLPRLSSWTGRWPAVAATTAAFAVLHVDANAYAMAAIVTYGAVMAVSVVYTASVLPAVGFHVINNVWNVALGVGSSNATTSAADGAIAVVSALLWLATVLLLHRRRVTASMPARVPGSS